jgi:hypothetical protein
MGAREVNFSNQLARRYGYEQAAATIQDLYLSRRKAEAAEAVPDDLVRGTSLVGPVGYVKQRLATYAAAGVTTLVVSPLAPTHAERVRAVSELRALADEI